MHRLNPTRALPLSASLCLVLVASAGCGGGGRPPESPSTAKDAGGDPEAGEHAGAEGEGGEAAAGTKKDVCLGFDIGDLEDLLVKSECEVPGANPDTLPNPEVKGKLEVTATASPTRTAPGGKVELLVTFANKTKEPMPLAFRIDPLARFETETYDAKNKRADMPAGNPPSPPKGHSAPPPAEAKVAKITVAAGGSARVRVPWEAVKMKWAPERVRGTAVERGFPRKPAGPLGKGTYTVKIVTPLVGVFEGSDHEVSSPKVDVEVAP